MTVDSPYPSLLRGRAYLELAIAELYDGRACCGDDEWDEARSLMFKALDKLGGSPWIVRRDREIMEGALQKLRDQ